MMQAGNAAKAPPAAPAPRDLLALAGAVAEVLQAENTALEANDLDRVRALSSRKAETAIRYEKACAGLKAHPDALRDLDPATRQNLVELIERIGALSLRNAKRLRGKAEAVNRLVGVIVAAARDQNRDGATAYSRRGRLDGGQAVAGSIAVNRTL